MQYISLQLPGKPTLINFVCTQSALHDVSAVSGLSEGAQLCPVDL